MPHGGLAPYPKRFGSAQGGLLEALTQSLIAARGPIFNPEDTTTIAWAESHAIARAIWETYETADRARNQFDPLRMSDFVPRWEAIFGISPLPGANLNERRKAIALRFARLLGGVHLGPLYALLAFYADIGATLKVWRTTDAGVMSHVYQSVTVPGGVTIAADGMWGSSIHQLTIICTQPSTMAWAAFVARMGALEADLFDAVPAWCTYYVAIKSSDTTLDFILDEPNLDLEALSAS